MLDLQQIKNLFSGPTKDDSCQAVVWFAMYIFMEVFSRLLIPIVAAAILDAQTMTIENHQNILHAKFLFNL